MFNVKKEKPKCDILKSELPTAEFAKKHGKQLTLDTCRREASSIFRF